jgi:hypothetical protein
MGLAGLGQLQMIGNIRTVSCLHVCVVDAIFV